MDTSTAVVERIRSLCKEQKITPNALSKKAGVSQSTVKSILIGESTSPGVTTIKKLCDGFGITITEFFDTKAFKGLKIETKNVKIVKSVEKEKTTPKTKLAVNKEARA